MDPLLSWIKLPKYLAWPLVVITGLLLWGSDGFKAGFGLQPFIEKYREWIGVAFLFFLILALQPIISSIYSSIMKRRDEKKKQEEDELQKKEEEKRRIEAINSLTADEKTILRYFLEVNSRTQDLNYQNGNVSKLTQLGFIYRASLVSYGGARGSFTFPYNIDDWAWSYLKSNPSVLGINEQT